MLNLANGVARLIFPCMSVSEESLDPVDDEERISGGICLSLNSTGVL